MKKLFNKMLVYFGYSLAVASLLIVFANMVAMGAFVLLLIVLVCGGSYLHLRNKNEY